MSLVTQDPRLDVRTAHKYEAMFTAQGWRVSVVSVFAGVYVLELRKPAGERGQVPPVTCRSENDCLRLLGGMQ